MIKVLIVEDSQVVQALLEHILTSDPEILVIGKVANGLEAIDFLADGNKPDVITMDIHMPKMNGFEATRQIMETKPVPIVIISASWNPEDVEKTFQALAAGAVAVLEKPMGLSHPNYDKMARNIVETVRAMSEVKVIRRWAQTRPRPQQPVQLDETAVRRSREIRCVAMGVSTGGPSALQTIFSRLPADFAAPILVVQHITEGFLPGMVEWLQKNTNLKVLIAEQGQTPLAGNVYFAPDGLQMGIDQDGRIALREEIPEHGSCPSVSYLLRSVANVYGAQAIGVLLTGMGKDGARELKLLHEKGGITIAQDKDSSVVHGMPGEAIRLGGVTHILSPDEIAAVLERLVNRKCGMKGGDYNG